ncbi:MAG: P-loop NTPase [Veillonellaceae bacterium]|jgi:ATP-binding protein involved in chromosome partitioning|nr:P-loop NTPase [Veillonellaceae bacterium]
MSCETQDNVTKQQDEKISSFLQDVKHKLLVMSGKGGVGKSTIAANLAVGLSNAGFKVGLLDVDIHGPSIAGMLGLTGHKLNYIGNTAIPFPYDENLKVLSIQGLLDQPDQPIIWRGPVKIGAIRQFLSDVFWGNLDYLIIDSPPGTGDEPLTIAQTIPDCKAVVVTTPQEISLADVRKSLNFCKKVNMEVLGIVENMSGFVCPSCGSVHEIFKAGGGAKTAQEWGIPFLGRLPIDPSVAAAGDSGMPNSDLNTPVQKEMQIIINNVINKQNKRADMDMKIAIPLVNGQLCAHFGHCEQFAIITVGQGKVTSKELLTPPPHAPGVIPNWIADQGCTNLIVGGMGEHAQQILASRGVSVLCGAPSLPLEELTNLFISGKLVGTGNACDHDHGDGHHCGH